MEYTYTITPRSEAAGGGWNLRLLEDGEEVGGGVFPPVEGIEDPEEAAQVAYDDAVGEALDWVNSHSPGGYTGSWPGACI